MVQSDARLDGGVVIYHVKILQDTLILHELPAWRRSVKRKPIVSSKYYFFDPGVVASLQGRRVSPGTPEFGELFETWLHHELASYRDYHSSEPLAYWRATSGFEVDFVVGDHTAIEAKAKETVGAQDLRGLRALAEERLLKRHLCVCLEPRRRTVEGIELWPCREFIDALWAGEFTG